MSARLVSIEMRRLERQLRLIAIMDAAERCGLVPISSHDLHAVAYLTDVLAPVWDLPVLDGHVLKRKGSPFFPPMQRDLDSLVGMGVVQVDQFRYQHGDDEWRLDADYSLYRPFADRILAALKEHESHRTSYTFTQEVVYAASGFGEDELRQLRNADAAYSDPLVDIGGLVTIADDGGKLNETAKVALRFQQLSESRRRFSSAEAIHLYVRHLYSRMNVA